MERGFLGSPLPRPPRAPPRPPRALPRPPRAAGAVAAALPPRLPPFCCLPAVMGKRPTGRLELEEAPWSMSIMSSLRPRPRALRTAPTPLPVALPPRLAPALAPDRCACGWLSRAPASPPPGMRCCVCWRWPPAREDEEEGPDWVTAGGARRRSCSSWRNLASHRLVHGFQQEGGAPRAQGSRAGGAGATGSSATRRGVTVVTGGADAVVASTIVGRRR